jgi:hypothetical protein
MSDEENMSRDYVSSMEQDQAANDPSMLLYGVKEALRKHAQNSIFAIGGEIKPGDVQRPVTIRWDSGKVALPLTDDKMSQTAFDQLLNACQPATFGRGNEDVLDVEYRKAGKMDNTDFCTDFNLAEYEIVSTVIQALVQSEVTTMSGVIASLYGLNVSPSPRSV